MTGARNAGVAQVAHKTWRTLEPLHGMIYFVPEAAEEYAALGVHGRDGYFASRAAPMGAVQADVVIATFFNFNPELIDHAIPGTWSIVSPDDLLAARLRAVDRSLLRILGPQVLASPEMARAAELARRAAEVASGSVEGRPLCAGHAQLPWPTDPHLALWHAQSILREFRGDGHIALLLTNGLSGIDALVTHAGQGEIDGELLRSTRGWTAEQWTQAMESLRSRGWLADAGSPSLSPWGAEQRMAIEDATDVLASAPYAALGEEACAELRALARPWSRAAVGELRMDRA